MPDVKTDPFGVRIIDHGGGFYKFTPKEISVTIGWKEKVGKYFLGIRVGTKEVERKRTFTVKYVTKEKVSDKVEVEKIVKAQ
jgi:hypothetical protein